jgi:hypothetical protein
MRELVVNDETKVRVYDRAEMLLAIERTTAETMGQPHDRRSSRFEENLRFAAYSMAHCRTALEGET